MNAALLGAFAALSWGVHDFVGGLCSRRLGYVTTVFGITAFGCLALTGWLAATSGFPNPMHPGIWLPLLAGLTYLAAAVTSILTLLYYISRAQQR